MTKEKRTRVATVHGVDTAQSFSTAGVPGNMVAKYAKECIAVDECQANLSEARKRRQHAYDACTAVSKFVDVVAGD